MTDDKRLIEEFARQTRILANAKFQLYRDGIAWFADAMQQAGFDPFDPETNPKIREVWKLADAEFRRRTGLNPPDACNWKSWRDVAESRYPTAHVDEMSLGELKETVRRCLLSSPDSAPPETETPQAPPDKSSNPTPTRKARRKPGQLNGEMLAMVESNPESQGWSSQEWARALRSNPSQIVKQSVWKAFEQLRLEQRAERQVGKRRGRSNQNVFDREGEAEKWSE